MQVDHTSRLPQETLCFIFHFARLMSDVPKLDAHARGSLHSNKHLPLREKLAWVSLTHVCARWRMLALGDPSLWTNVPVVLGRKWMYEFIARSRGLPFFVDQGPTVDEVTHELAPEHYQRLRNAEVGTHPSDTTLTLLAHPWPELAELDFTFRDDFDMHTLLGGHAPRLRSLRLHEWIGSAGSAFTWQAPFLDTCPLVKLDFEIHEEIPHTALSGFVDVLARIRQLEHLRFIGKHSCSPIQCAFCRPGAGHSYGASLKHLELGCDLGITTSIIRHIFPQPDTRIVINVGKSSWRETRSEEHKQNDVRDICMRIREWRGGQGQCLRTDSESSHSSPLPYAAFELDVNFTCELGVRAASSPNFHTKFIRGHWDQGPGGPYPDLKMSFWSLHSGSAMAQVISTVSEFLAVPSTRFLSIINSRMLPSRFLNHLTPSVFPHVEVLRLSRSPPVHLRQLNNFNYTSKEGNGASPAGNSGNAVSHWLFPALNILDLEKCQKGIHRVFIDALIETMSARNSTPTDTTTALHTSLLVYLTITEIDGLPRATAMPLPPSTSAFVDELRSIKSVKIGVEGDLNWQQERFKSYEQNVE